MRYQNMSENLPITRLLFQKKKSWRILFKISGSELQT